MSYALSYVFGAFWPVVFTGHFLTEKGPVDKVWLLDALTQGHEGVRYADYPVSRVPRHVFAASFIAVFAIVAGSTFPRTAVRIRESIPRGKGVAA